MIMYLEITLCIAATAAVALMVLAVIDIARSIL
jgi:hypothetical protein